MAETHEAVRCDAAITLAFSVLGKRWNGMILDALGNGAHSFVMLRRAVTGISDAVLSERLTGLAEVGLVVRAVEAGPPVTVSYCLSEGGRSLMPVLGQLGTWARDHLTPVVSR